MPTPSTGPTKGSPRLPDGHRDGHLADRLAGPLADHPAGRPVAGDAVAGPVSQGSLRHLAGKEQTALALAL